MKTKPLALLLTVAGLSAGLAAAPNFAYDRPTVKTIQNSGSPFAKVDLVFISDGYTANQSKDFEKDVRDATEELFRYPLYKEYRSYFNVHSAFVPSVQETTKVSYAFGSERNERQGLVVIKREDEVRRVAAKAPACDVPIVISTMLGRAHAGDIIVLPSRDFGPLAHELGHTIGGLGDEYTSGSSLNDRGRLPQGRDLPYPNLTLPNYIDPANAKTVQATAKWGHFLALPGAYPLVSAYQGGGHYEIGVWRPSFACIMKESSAPFCPVCHESMVKAIYQLCGMRFDDAAYHRKHPLSQWR
jgi:hypothetical protein